MRGTRGFDYCKNVLDYSLRFSKEIFAKNFISHPIKPYVEYIAETKKLLDSFNPDILIENVFGIKLDQINFLGRPIVLDVGNLIKNGEYSRIEEYIPNLRWIHIHDFKEGKDHLPLGQGIVDLESLIRIFPAEGYTIELGSIFREWKNLRQDYRDSIDFINNARISQTSYGKNVRLAHLLRNVSIEKVNLVVDFGCGEGYLLHNTPANIKEGYDLNPRSVFNDVNYFSKNLHDLNLSGVDLAICSEVIEHLEEDVPVIRKIHKSLKNGGRVFLTTINNNTSVDKSRQDRERGHFRRYGCELKDIMESQGFRTTAFYPFRSKHYYSHKGDFKSYRLKEDIAGGNEDASGWVYFGVKGGKR
jgi:SAM-dependent methyltransferase